jgi:hypothetical protein
MCSCDNKPIGQSAEDQFREAFVRLRNGQPRVLPLGTAVTQSNVSREAGCDPSALRKTRYPELISEIQKYVLRARGGVESDNLHRCGSQPSMLSEKIAQLQSDRDHVMSLLLEADNTILELTLELAKLRRVPDR